jgi:multiple antibiotic resistance protein
MLYAQQENNDFKIAGAILLAWVGVTAVLTGAPYLQKALGKRGMLALEQFMGMILSMMAVEMLVMGAALFVKSVTT